MCEGALLAAEKLPVRNCIIAVNNCIVQLYRKASQQEQRNLNSFALFPPEKLSKKNYVKESVEYEVLKRNLKKLRKAR